MLALNEVQNMAAKAARGAGFPLGQAEDVGRVAAYLAGTGGSVAPVTQGLQEPRTPVEVCWRKDCLEVLSGPAILIAPIVCDALKMGYATAKLAEVSHAPLVSAFLATAGIAQIWDGPTVAPSDTTILPMRKGAVTIPPHDWDVWCQFAARTYVPASDASRLAGAGAGLTDND